MTLHILANDSCYRPHTEGAERLTDANRYVVMFDDSALVERFIVFTDSHGTPDDIRKFDNLEDAVRNQGRRIRERFLELGWKPPVDVRVEQAWIHAHGTPAGDKVVFDRFLFLLSARN